MHNHPKSLKNVLKILLVCALHLQKYIRKVGTIPCFASSPRSAFFALALSNACCRLITEVRSHDESLFSCIACTQDEKGEPLLFAGTNQGSILQLALDDIGAEESEQGGLVPSK